MKTSKMSQAVKRIDSTREIVECFIRPRLGRLYVYCKNNKLVTPGCHLFIQIRMRKEVEAAHEAARCNCCTVCGKLHPQDTNLLLLGMRAETDQNTNTLLELSTAQEIADKAQKKLCSLQKRMRKMGIELSSSSGSSNPFQLMVGKEHTVAVSLFVDKKGL